jgi:hypothetical protein
VFPHLVSGAGYTTQFILFSGSAGQSGSGNLRMVKQDGSAFPLSVTSSVEDADALSEGKFSATAVK